LLQLQQPQHRMMVQPTRQSRRWLKLNDWKMPGQDKIVRTVLELSAEEPGRLSLTPHFA